MDQKPGSTGPITMRALYTGRVQGVGFRYTTRRIAKAYAVTGYVKNLPDGTVELVAQGLDSEVEALFSSVEDQFRSHLRGNDRTIVTNPEHFSTFEIRF